MTPTHYIYELSAADITMLRVWSHSTGFISDGTDAGFPFITFILSDRTYALHSQGRTVAVSPSPDIISACLRNERIEPGYCRRILDPLTPPDVASLSPEARLAHARQNALSADQERRYAEEQEAIRRRRFTQTHVDVNAVTLDDLL